MLVPNQTEMPIQLKIYLFGFKKIICYRFYGATLGSHSTCLYSDGSGISFDANAHCPAMLKRTYYSTQSTSDFTFLS